MNCEVEKSKISGELVLDTHGHVQFNAFADDYREVIGRTVKQGGWIVMPGTQIDTSSRAIEVASQYEEGIYAAVGLHPSHLQETRLDTNELGGGQEGFRTRTEEFDSAEYEKLVRSSDKVVAVGEIGLDYWRRPKTTARRAAYMQKQADAFTQQLDFAVEHKLPVILHCRVAFDDMLAIVKSHPITHSKTPPGVVHSFTGDVEVLTKFLALGYMIAYNALIFTLPHLPDAVRRTPLDRMVLETDSPYLTPPELGEVRNEPSNTLITAQYIAELKEIGLEKVLEQTTLNARELFKI